MTTEREKRALRIAKSAYQHFTHDALELAKEILALEREMEEDQEDPVIIPVKTLPPPNDLPEKNEAPVSSIRLAGSFHYPGMHSDSATVEAEHEEVPY